MAERRLEDVGRRLTDLANTLGEVSKDLRTQIRVSDQQAAMLTRLEERLKETEAELRDVPKRLERLATSDWMQRVEQRVTVMEGESTPFVRKAEFNPVRSAVFTLIGAVCIAVLGAVTKLIMK